MCLAILRERGKKKHQWVNQPPPIRTPAGDRTSNPGMCPDQGSNLQPFGAQDDSPNNWATQPGQGEWFIQIPTIWEDGGLLSQNPSFFFFSILTSSAGRGLYKEGEEKQNKEIKGGGWKVLYVQMSTVHSHKDPETGQVVIRYASSWSLSSWFYIILVLWLKVRQSPRAGMTESWSLYLLKLVPSYTYMLFIYKLCIHQSQHLQKKCRKDGDVGYNPPLLQSDTHSIIPMDISLLKISRSTTGVLCRLKNACMIALAYGLGTELLAAQKPTCPKYVSWLEDSDFATVQSA